MSAQPNYDACDTWQDIVAEHRRTLQLPPSTVCTDAKLTEWRERANAVLEPPSSDVPGPALALLVQNEPTKTVWSSELEALHTAPASRPPVSDVAALPTAAPAPA